MLRATQALLKQATRWLLDRRDELPGHRRGGAATQPGRHGADRLPAGGAAGQPAGALRGRGAALRRYRPAAPLARKVAALAPMHTALDIIALAENCRVGVRHAADVYFRVGDQLELDWLSDQVDPAVEGMWQAKARGSLRDNLYGLHRAVCASSSTAGWRRGMPWPRSRPGWRRASSAWHISAIHWKRCATAGSSILRPSRSRSRKSVAWPRTEPATSQGKDMATNR
jgi:hypothetical protein